jgi:hypothetical protein
LHRSHVINIKGRSYRLRDLEETLNSALMKSAAKWAGLTEC